MLSWILIVAVTIPVFIAGQIAGLWSGVTKLTALRIGEREEWPLDCVPLWLTQKSLSILILSELVGQVLLFGLTWYLRGFLAAVIFIIAYYVFTNLTCRRLFAAWCREHPKQVARAEKSRQAREKIEACQNE